MISLMNESVSSSLLSRITINAVPNPNFTNEISPTDRTILFKVYSYNYRYREIIAIPISSNWNLLYEQHYSLTTEMLHK